MRSSSAVLCGCDRLVRRWRWLWKLEPAFIPRSASSSSIECRWTDTGSRLRVRTAARRRRSPPAVHLRRPAPPRRLGPPQRLLAVGVRRPAARGPRPRSPAPPLRHDRRLADGRVRGDEAAVWLVRHRAVPGRRRVRLCDRPSRVRRRRPPNGDRPTAGSTAARLCPADAVSALVAQRVQQCRTVAGRRTSPQPSAKWPGRNTTSSTDGQFTSSRRFRRRSSTTEKIYRTEHRRRHFGVSMLHGVMNWEEQQWWRCTLRSIICIRPENHDFREIRRSRKYYKEPYQANDFPNITHHCKVFCSK